MSALLRASQKSISEFKLSPYEYTEFLFIPRLDASTYDNQYPHHAIQVKLALSLPSHLIVPTPRLSTQAPPCSRPCACCYQYVSLTPTHTQYIKTFLLACVRTHLHSLISQALFAANPPLRTDLKHPIYGYIASSLSSSISSSQLQEAMFGPGAASADSCGSSGALSSSPTTRAPASTSSSLGVPTYPHDLRPPRTLSPADVMLSDLVAFLVTDEVYQPTSSKLSSSVGGTPFIPPAESCPLLLFRCGVFSGVSMATAIASTLREMMNYSRRGKAPGGGGADMRRIEMREKTIGSVNVGNRAKREGGEEEQENVGGDVQSNVIDGGDVEEMGVLENDSESILSRYISEKLEVEESQKTPTKASKLYHRTKPGKMSPEFTIPPNFSEISYSRPTRTDVSFLYQLSLAREMLVSQTFSHSTVSGSIEQEVRSQSPKISAHQSLKPRQRHRPPTTTLAAATANDGSVDAGAGTGVSVGGAEASLGTSTSLDVGSGRGMGADAEVVRVYTRECRHDATSSSSSSPQHSLLLPRTPHCPSSLALTCTVPYPGIVANKQWRARADSAWLCAREYVLRDVAERERMREKKGMRRMLAEVVGEQRKESEGGDVRQHDDNVQEEEQDYASRNRTTHSSLHSDLTMLDSDLVATESPRPSDAVDEGSLPNALLQAGPDELFVHTCAFFSGIWECVCATYTEARSIDYYTDQ